MVPTDQEHLDMKFTVNEIAKSANWALSSLYIKFLHVGVWIIAYFATCMNLWSSRCCSTGQVSGVQVSKRRLVQYKIKPVGISWGCVKMRPTLHRRATIGWTSCNMKQKIEACRLYFKNQGTAENRVVRKCFTGQAYMVNHGKVILSKHDLQDLLNKDCSVKEKVNFAKDKLKIIDINVRKNKLWNDSGQESGNKLRTYSQTI